MISQDVPALVAVLADKLKMTPIAWHIEPTFVVIVFEQGPKMRFERESDIDLVKPVIRDQVLAHSDVIDDVAGYIKAAKGKSLVAHKKPAKVSSKSAKS